MNINEEGIGRRRANKRGARGTRGGNDCVRYDVVRCHTHIVECTRMERLSREGSFDYFSKVKVTTPTRRFHHRSTRFYLVPHSTRPSISCTVPSASISRHFIHREPNEVRLDEWIDASQYVGRLIILYLCCIMHHRPSHRLH